MFIIQILKIIIIKDENLFDHIYNSCYKNQSRQISVEVIPKEGCVRALEKYIFNKI